MSRTLELVDFKNFISSQFVYGMTLIHSVLPCSLVKHALIIATVTVTSQYCIEIGLLCHAQQKIVT
jgi:hypothetical protein